MLAVGAVLIEYLPLARPDDVGGEGWFTYATLTEVDAGADLGEPMAVHRGALAAVKMDGYEARVGWGLYVGLVLLAAQVLALAAATVAAMRRGTRAEAVEDR
jgi:hypothetical protein